jgi:hypothetical protein
VKSTTVAPVVLALGLAGPAPLSGQAAAIPRIQPSLSALRWSPPVVSPEARSGTSGHGIFGDGSHDYRYPGLFAGLGAGAAISIWFITSEEGDASTGSILAGSLLVTAVLGVTGALIGSAFDR